MPQVGELHCVFPPENCPVTSPLASDFCAECDGDLLYPNKDGRCISCQDYLDPYCSLVNEYGQIIECAHGLVPSVDKRSCQEPYIVLIADPNDPNIE